MGSLTFPRIYLGPSLPASYLRHGTVFADGYPKLLLSMLEKHPEIGRLIVPVSEIAATREEIRHKGTVLNATYAKVFEILKEL